MRQRFSVSHASIALPLSCVLILTGSACARLHNAERPCCAAATVKTSLRDRVTLPHQETIAAYVQSGAQNAKAHQLSEREWSLVERALADLPPMYRQILGRRLGRLSFIDAPSSAGTALTRSYNGPDGKQRFDITIRADVLDMSLTDFLAGKEERLFAEDGSGYTLHVNAGKMPALTYLLLHETTHVLDQTYDITTGARPFAVPWRNYRTLSEPYASGPMGVSIYRRGPPLVRVKMPALYRALANSPFVSLYSTASAGEDFAELCAWSLLARQSQVTLTLQVRDAKGNTAVEVDPLTLPAVRSRLDGVQRILADIGALS